MPFGGPPPGHTPGFAPWVAITVLSVVGIWAVGVTVAMQTVGWFVEQVLLTLEIDLPAYGWPLISLANAFLVALAVVPAALVIRRPRPRAVARTWAVATGCLAVLGIARAVPMLRLELALGTLALAAGVLASAGWLLTRRAERSPALNGVLPAFAAGLVGLLSWLWLGALGSLTETVVALLAAITVGALAGLVLSRLLWPAFAAEPLSRWAHVAVVGLAAGVALALIAAGTGPSGVQLALLLTVPPAGFALAALARSANRLVAGAVLVALLVLGPLAFVDPEELTILLGTHDVGRYALIAALLGALAAALVGLVLTLTTAGPPQRAPATTTGPPPAEPAAASGPPQREPAVAADPTPSAASRAPRRIVAAGVAAAVLVAGVGVHAAAGQPGFHGERLFVLLESQPDLSGLAQVTDVDDRRKQTYDLLVRHAEESQRGLREELADRGIEYRPYYLVNAVEVPDNPVNRVWLSGRDDVDRVLASPRLRPLPFAPPIERGAETTAPSEPVWGVESIGAPQVWRDLDVDGTGVVVGESDSGVDGSHPALKENYRGAGATVNNDYNWYDPWNNTRSPTDIGGHGTHTTGTAVGRQNIGVAPGAQWIGCVNLARNLGSPTYYVDCLQFMLAPFPQGGDAFRDGDPTRAADVLNNSWGCPEIEGCDVDSLRPAVRALTAAGIFVVVSAGNTGDRCSTIEDPLALYPEAFTVGAVDRQRRISTFSSRGPVTLDGGELDKPDLVAPGEEVLSALPGSTYGENEGTSMAGPHVAGVVALMWQANPKLVGDIGRTADLLRQTAKPVDPTFRAHNEKCGGRANVVGAGVVDALGAVEAAVAAR